MLPRSQATYVVTASGERSGLVTRDNSELRKMKNISRTKQVLPLQPSKVSSFD